MWTGTWRASGPRRWPYLVTWTPEMATILPVAGGHCGASSHRGPPGDIRRGPGVCKYYCQWWQIFLLPWRLCICPCSDLFDVYYRVCSIDQTDPRRVRTDHTGHCHQQSVLKYLNHQNIFKLSSEMSKIRWPCCIIAIILFVVGLDFTLGVQSLLGTLSLMWRYE